MGKAAKKRRQHRFDPLARPANRDDEMHDDADEPQPKLSAHQAKHFERKRLQQEARDLKRQRGKVSKANKLAHSIEKKALSKSLQAVRAELRGGGLLSMAPAAAEDPAAGDNPPAAEVPPFAGFDLPMPQRSV